MDSCFKKPIQKHPQSYTTYLERLGEYRIKLQETRQVMNEVIRQAVYRDAQIDINQHYQKEKINQLTQEMVQLKEQNQDLKERLDYYQRLSDEPPSIIYMDFSIKDGVLCLDSAYQNDPENEIEIQPSQVSGKQNKECFAIDIDWI